MLSFKAKALSFCKEAKIVAVLLAILYSLLCYLFMLFFFFFKSETPLALLLFVPFVASERSGPKLLKLGQG